MTWSENCSIDYTNVRNQVVTFTIDDTKLYVLVLTLLIQGNAKLLQQLQPSFKRTIDCNKYLLSKFKLFIWTKFLRSKQTFYLAFENDAKRTSNKRYYLPNL